MAEFAKAHSHPTLQTTLRPAITLHMQAWYRLSLDSRLRGCDGSAGMTKETRA